MTLCERCGEEFENYYLGYNWCPGCGKITHPELKDTPNS